MYSEITWGESVIHIPQNGIHCTCQHLKISIGEKRHVKFKYVQNVLDHCEIKQQCKNACPVNRIAFHQKIKIEGILQISNDENLKNKESPFKFKIGRLDKYGMAFVTYIHMYLYDRPRVI